jgi:hypothetical protein
MNAKLYNQVEIAFWDLVIYALSESPFVRTLVRRVYRFLPGKNAQTVLIAAGIGLLSGFIFYLVAFRLFQG